MRIAFICPGIYPCVTGGAEVFNYNLIKALANDHECIVISHCDNIDFAKLFKLKKYKPTKIFSPLQILKLLYLKRKEIDVVHISYMRSHWLIWAIYPLLNSLIGLQYVMTIHGGGLSIWKPFFIHKLLFKKAKSITAVSRRSIQEYEKRSGRSICFTPPIIPFHVSTKSNQTILQNFGLDRTAKYILYVGSIKDIKDPRTLILAFNEISKDFIIRENLHLLLAGDGPLKNELFNLTIDLNIQSRVHFLGIIKRENVPDLYKIANIFIITSLFENTPIVMLEAMFNKLPIVASDAPGIRDIIIDKKNGLVFPVGNIKRLANNIKTIVNDSSLRQKIAMEAEKTYLKKYDFRGMLEIFQNVFKP